MKPDPLFSIILFIVLLLFLPHYFSWLGRIADKDAGGKEKNVDYGHEYKGPIVGSLNHNDKVTGQYNVTFGMPSPTTENGNECGIHNGLMLGKYAPNPSRHYVAIDTCVNTPIFPFILRLPTWSVWVIGIGLVCIGLIALWYGFALIQILRLNK